MQARRLICAAAGGLLLLGTIIEAGRGGFGFYQEHYLIPKEKYGILTPLRWQDDAALILFLLVLMGLGYIAYRLLKYAFRREVSHTA